MTDVKTFDGFLSALNNEVEGAKLLVGDAEAFLRATKSIERLLSEDWPAIEQNLRAEGVRPDDRQRLLDLLASITALETKTRARLVWAEDFEAHLRQAMERS